MTFFISSTELLAIISNSSWFDGYYVKWKKISDNRFRVKTNYQWER